METPNNLQLPTNKKAKNDDFVYDGIRDEKSKQKYFEELKHTLARLLTVKKLMGQVLAPFIELEKILDACADGGETDKECYKRQEYQDTKAMILAYDEFYRNNSHAIMLEKELDFLEAKANYLKNELKKYYEQENTN